MIDPRVMMRANLVTQLELTSAQREQKTKKFPHDVQDEDATEIALRLSKEINALDLAVFDAITHLYDFLCFKGEDNAVLNVQRELARKIGACTAINSGAEFVNAMTETLLGRLSENQRLTFDNYDGTGTSTVVQLKHPHR